MVSLWSCNKTVAGRRDSGSTERATAARCATDSPTPAKPKHLPGAVESVAPWCDPRRLAPRKCRAAVTAKGCASVDLDMKVYVSLVLLIALAVMVPGGSLLLPLVYSQYRKVLARARAQEACP